MECGVTAKKPNSGESASSATTKRVCLGAFAGAHGVKGEAKVKTFTEEPAGIAAYGPVTSEDGKRRFTLKFVRVLKPDLALVTAPEIASREEAAALAGTRLYVARAALPATDADEFYLEDLIGLAAVDDSGAPLGKVVGIHNFGAGDLIELKGSSGAIIVPFTNETIVAAELAEGRIVIARAALEEIEAGGPSAVLEP